MNIMRHLLWEHAFIQPLGHMVWLRFWRSCGLTEICLLHRRDFRNRAMCIWITQRNLNTGRRKRIMVTKTGSKNRGDFLPIKKGMEAVLEKRRWMLALFPSKKEGLLFFLSSKRETLFSTAQFIRISYFANGKYLLGKCIIFQFFTSPFRYFYSVFFVILIADTLPKLL